MQSHRQGGLALQYQTSLRHLPLVTGLRIALLCFRQTANHVTVVHGRCDALHDRHTRLR
jgi:hypothetical protein